jgi:5-methylcytosine-specific restriction endonuclease McrA
MERGGRPAPCLELRRKETTAMSHVANRTLLLSQGFEPIKVISWQRAITLLTLGKVEVIEEYDAEIKAVSVVIKAPAVVRLLRAFRRHAKPVKFSRVNIYARDGYRCQYCGAVARWRAHLRPRDPARPRRPHHVGEHRHLLLPVQRRQG